MLCVDIYFTKCLIPQFRSSTFSKPIGFTQFSHALYTYNKDGHSSNFNNTFLISSGDLRMAFNIHISTNTLITPFYLISKKTRLSPQCSSSCKLSLELSSVFHPKQSGPFRVHTPQTLPASSHYLIPNPLLHF